MKTKTRKKKKQQTHYYVVRCSHNDEYADDVLEEAVGKQSDGSGFGFGERDLDWTFSHLRQALKAFKALSKYRYLNNLAIEYIRDY